MTTVLIFFFLEKVYEYKKFDKIYDCYYDKLLVVCKKLKFNSEFRKELVKQLIYIYIYICVYNIKGKAQIIKTVY